MTKDETYDNSDSWVNHKTNTFEVNVISKDSNAALMSQRMAVAKEPSGLIKLDHRSKRDQF